MGKVLIIDDENQLRGLLARIIGLEGYEVIQADSCKAGLKQVEQQNPDVIICDVRLPDGSGVDLTTEMKRLFFSSGSFSFSAESISIIFVFLIVRVLKTPTTKKLTTKNITVSKTVSGNNVHEIS